MVDTASLDLVPDENAPAAMRSSDNLQLVPDENAPEAGSHKQKATEGYDNELEIWGPVAKAGRILAAGARTLAGVANSGEAMRAWNSDSSQNAGTGIGISQNKANYLAGAGETYNELGQGAQQHYQHMASVFTGDDTKANALDRAIRQHKQEDQDLNNTAAGKWGQATPGLIASSLAPGTFAGQMGMAAAQGALTSSADYDGGYGAVENASSEAAGAGIGLGLGKAAGKMIQPFAPKIAAKVKALGIFQKEGLLPELDAAQRTGSSWLNSLKGVAQDSPVTGGTSNDAAVHASVVQKMLKKIGLKDDDVLSPETLKDYGKTLGTTRENIYNRNPLNIDGAAKVPATIGNKLPVKAKTLNDSFTSIIKDADAAGYKGYGLRRNYTGSFPKNPNSDYSNPINIINQIRANVDPKTGIINPVTLNRMRQEVTSLYGTDKEFGGRLATLLDQHMGFQESKAGDGALLQLTNTRLSGLRKIAAASADGTKPLSFAALSRVMKKSNPRDSLKQLADASNTLFGGGGYSSTAARLIGSGFLGAGAASIGSLLVNPTEGWKDALGWGAAGLATPLAARAISGKVTAKALSRWQDSETARLLSKGLQRTGAAYMAQRGNTSASPPPINKQLPSRLLQQYSGNQSANSDLPDNITPPDWSGLK